MALTLALAGRRIDAADSEKPRFPLANASIVRDRLREFFIKKEVGTLVCSAACGADLVALEAAEHLRLRRRIVLPFAAERFRATSVTDRPGDWGPIYDRIIEAVQGVGDLIVLEHSGEESAAYQGANRRILEEVLLCERAGPVVRVTPADAALAVIVWEGASRGSDDATQQFADLAKQGGLAVEEILTI